MHELEKIASQIVDSAIKVHRSLGPGLLESAYQVCLAYELENRGYSVACEVIQPITYETVQIDSGYRIDMLVEDQIIIENKCVKEILPIHLAQILTYLKLHKSKLGFIINWHVPLIKDGIKRVIDSK
jgi:GxxExxY protein